MNTDCETSSHLPNRLQTFFYLAFGLFTLLSVTCLLAVPSPQWGFGLPAAGDLVELTAAPLATAAAEDWAEEARLREAEEARLLREARAPGTDPEGRDRDDDWSLRLH